MLRPLGDRIVVRAIEPERVRASGLVIPEQALEKPQRGEVLAVGSGYFLAGERVPLEVQVGDSVLYSKFGGSIVEVEGEPLMVLREADILAVIE